MGICFSAGEQYGHGRDQSQDEQFCKEKPVQVGSEKVPSPTKSNRVGATYPGKLDDPTTTSPGKACNKGEKSDEFQSTNRILYSPRSVNDLRLIPGYSNVDIFTYAEMKQATKCFRSDQIIGEGGFGIVYKGVIDEQVRHAYQTTLVAIKELNPDGLQGEKEWLAEVNYLGQLCHPNLVKLIGYCCEDEHRILVYEYMASGSLESILFRRVGTSLSWSKRMKIALDAAKGLSFLHCAERCIIYRDFKTSNILLDMDYNAKLSDFGLAKDGPMGDKTHVSTRVMGTYGYAAPEYVMTGHLTARSDVYGFGVVLLEMLVGRRAMDKSRPSREHSLVEWARPLLIHNKKLLRVIDPRMGGQYTARCAFKVANLAYQCLSQNPKGRPVMCQVVELLEALQASVADSQEEAMLQSGEGCVTLYEALPGEEKKIKVENGRSKSEPVSGVDFCSQPPDLAFDGKSVSSRGA